MSWFYRIFGFEEFAQAARVDAFQRVRQHLTLSSVGDCNVLTSTDGRKFWVGRYTQESLESLNSSLVVRSSSQNVPYLLL
jgi:hypothetical protein